MDARPDLGFLFATHHHRERMGVLAREVRARTHVRHLLGCTAESVIGGGRELEGEPAVSLSLAYLPGVDVEPFTVHCEPTPDGVCFPVHPSGVFHSVGENAAAFLLGEPYTMHVDAFVRRFSEDHPGIPMVGGMASGGRDLGQNTLYAEGELWDQGAVGVLLGGRLELRTIVSQGCRPIGRRYVVTSCDRNTIHSLGGRPALDCIRDLCSSISKSEWNSFRLSPHVGVAIDERRHDFGIGDFLIRNILGVDARRKAIFLCDSVRRGQTVQFHCRNEEAATEELEALIEREKAGRVGGGPLGGLIFTCNGRGTRLFSHPHHDVTALRRGLGMIPFGGFFAQGEIGPVGKRNHLHGFTASVALFHEPNP